MSQKFYTPFYLETTFQETQYVCGSIGWEEAVRFHAQAWDYSLEKTCETLLRGATLSGRHLSLPKFSMYPMYRGCSPTLGEWGENMEMNLRIFTSEDAQVTE